MGRMENRRNMPDPFGNDFNLNSIAFDFLSAFRLKAEGNYQ